MQNKFGNENNAALDANELLRKSWEGKYFSLVQMFINREDVKKRFTK